MKKVKEFPLQKKRKLIQETYLEEVDMGHEDVSQLKKAIKERVFELTDKISSEDFEKLFADLKEKERAKAQIKSAIQTGLNVHNIQENVEMLHETCPFCYNIAKFFYFWSDIEHKWIESDDTGVMCSIDNALKLRGQTSRASVKNEYLEVVKRVGRENMPQECPAEVIQFGQTLFNINTKKKTKVTPKYLLLNPIPHEIGESSETPAIDNMITEWVGEDAVLTVKQIIAYCCLNDYPINRIFVFTGGGSNGKSTLMRLIETFIGRSNICSTSLDALSENRFEAFNLYGKKVASIGETNFGLLQKTELIKRLSGRDTITYEAKNKGAFFGINTAKLIISSNSLPTSDDTSDGFYRRFLIVDFPNQFTEKQDILKKIPVEEYSNLAKWCVDNLPGILETGGFHNEGDIEHRKKKYIMASNPLPIFIEQFCDVGEDNKKYWVSGSNLYTEFVKMLTLNKRRVVKRKEFHTAMTELGFEQAKVTRNFGDHEIFNGWAYLGLRLNLGKVTKVTKVTRFSTNPPRIENQVENSSRLSLLSLKDELVAVFGALERLETPELSLFVTPEKVDLACSQGLIMEIKPGIWQLTGVSDGNH